MEGFNVLELLGQSKGDRDGRGYKEITLEIGEIAVTGENRYSMEEVEDLATGILMTGGIQQPLVLGKVDGEYILISGHRRMEALKKLIEEGREEYKRVPCRYREMTRTEAKIELLCGNTFNRKMTDHDLMVQAEEWKKVLEQAKREGILRIEKGKRIRDYVARILGESTGKIGTLNAIRENAAEEVKEEFRAGNIGITAAYTMSQLPEEAQREIMQDTAEAAEDQRAKEIQELVEKKKINRAEEEAKKESVSDTDTQEEEKEKAKKLHLLKMLEKYYIYLSGEEEELLEKILEDCKRRKREYALD